jgi:hypothetical protein
MNTFLQKNHRVLFYGCWLMLGLIQSARTELLDDEAYYWVYSHFLDWGYFDHPPMTGLLIKMGYSLFPDELGVRLFPLLLNVLTLLLIEKLIDKKNPFLFYAIALSVAVLQISGFVAVPDIPLIFFTALFFVCFRKFINRFSWLNTFLLGISVALLLYSKYHAVLIIFFTLLSDRKLFLKYQTYIAGFIALLLFAPHLWWQYQHDWVSFRYHLFESNVNPYKVSYTLDYIFGQLLLPGPIAGFILLPAAFLYKTKNPTEKALRYSMTGIYLFFLLSSFRGKVEANWTSPVLISIFVLSHQFLYDKIRWQKILYQLLPVTIVLVLVARIIMIEDILPIKFVRERYHAWKSWPGEMKKITQDLPVVFNNSYQLASKYWFYTGQKAYSQNQYKGRKNNFNFWPVEDSLLGKQIYFLDKYDLWRCTDSLNTPLGWIGYRYDSLFASFTKIKIRVGSISLKANENTEIPIHCHFVIPSLYRKFILQHPLLQDTIRIGVFDHSGWKKDIFTGLSLQEVVAKEDTLLKINPRLPTGKYYLRFAISEGYQNPTHNSDKIELVVD